MEQRFSNESIDLVTLREFFAGQSGIAERCERKGEALIYRKGDQLERERLRVGGRCTGIDREHITWLDKSLTFGPISKIRKEIIF